MDSRTSEWKGWTEDMPVQVVQKGHPVEVYPNLAAAKLKHPDLDPRRNTSKWTWATHGEVHGRPAIRFEDWAAEKMYSQASTSERVLQRYLRLL